MKWFLVVFAALALGILPLACGDNNSNPSNPMQPTNTPTITHTPCGYPSDTCTPTVTFTPTNTPIVDVVFSVVGSYPLYYYSTTGTGGVAVSTPVTITTGHAAVWDSSNAVIHPLYLDNTSACQIMGNLTYPLTQILTNGTYHAHCGSHGACSSGDGMCPNTTCTGMAVTIVAQ